ncbi:swr1 complex snf2 family DNA-dependent ATPase, partial [Chrysochromulina tobinii]
MQSPEAAGEEAEEPPEPPEQTDAAAPPLDAAAQPEQEQEDGIGEHCGKCEACLDKVKFGGLGRKRKACFVLAKLALHKQLKTSKSTEPRVKKGPPVEAATASSSNTAPAGDGPLSSAAATAADHATAAAQVDCGTCSNCLDKVKFGGPGIKRRNSSGAPLADADMADADAPSTGAALTGPSSGARMMPPAPRSSRHSLGSVVKSEDVKLDVDAPPSLDQSTWNIKTWKKVQEPQRNKTHHDYLLQEMEWLSRDFREERQWKVALARKAAKAVTRWHAERAQLTESGGSKSAEYQTKQLAKAICREVLDVWQQVGRVVAYKHDLRLEEARQESRNKHLEFIVGQTQRYTEMLTDGMNRAEGDAMEVEEGNGNGVGGKKAVVSAENDAELTISAGSQVSVKIPHLIRGTLREYQHVALDWLVSMHEKSLNGILADEMGLGKTLMTISALAWLACEKGVWGPHLVVVPTSVMLNWEMEFKKFAPGFKILTYFGSQKERRAKRAGWSKTNAFHVCITSYKLVIQDAAAFRRKKWKYLILDEAHHIKNFQSQRWQTLLNFNSKRRLLLTGTPLQNNLMELWSLLHFLMPHVFESHREFKEWFSNPVTGMVEGTETVNEGLITRLHSILRPFLLRRLKKDVEKSLLPKIEHVVPCPLSKRQRELYEDFMNNSETRAKLGSGSLIGIMNVLMQLRKVCNHPDLFEERPIRSPHDMAPLLIQTAGFVLHALDDGPLSDVVHLDLFNLNLAAYCELDSYDAVRTYALHTRAQYIVDVSAKRGDGGALQERRLQWRKGVRTHMAYLNTRRCQRTPLYGHGLRRSVEVTLAVAKLHAIADADVTPLEVPAALRELVPSYSRRLETMSPLLEAFTTQISRARAPAARLSTRHDPSEAALAARGLALMRAAPETRLAQLQPLRVRSSLAFPDKRLIQWDCGKLQVLSTLLRQLHSGGHRCLIFTQMTKMLNVLESWINICGYTYLRLDGATKVDERQKLMDRFNLNPKIFIFILATRAGGLGINLTGADTVIFYDSDWNPTIDAQAQDRAHRIGQTRQVHIYRLISEATVEENILRKANQKRLLDDVVIQSGGFTTDFFKGLSAEEMELALLQAQDAEDRDAFASERRLREAETAEFDESITWHEDAPERDGNTTDAGGATGGATDTGAETDLDGGDAGAKKKKGAVAGSSALVKAGGAASGPEVDKEDMADFGVQADKSQTKTMMENLEAALTPVQRYMMRFLEETSPLQTEAEEAQLAFAQEEWQLAELQQRQEEMEALADEDDECLYYEVPIKPAVAEDAKGGGRGRKGRSSDAASGGGAAAGALGEMTSYIASQRGALSGLEYAEELQRLEIELWGPPQPPGRDTEELYEAPPPPLTSDEEMLGAHGGAFAEADGTVQTLEFAGIVTEGARGVQRVRDAISERKRQARDADLDDTAAERQAAAFAASEAEKAAATEKEAAEKASAEKAATEAAEAAAAAA